MNGTYEARRRWVDKIAFFGLFIAVLLIAFFLVIWRSAIVLSEPIELNCAGLSVCIPTGTGWRSENTWKYHQNAFTLNSFFNPSSVTTVVSVRYYLAATKATPDALFEEKASTLGEAEIAKTGQIEMSRSGFSPAKDSQSRSIPTLNWAHIKKSKTLLDAFFGIAQLPNNRRLDIEVYQATGDTDLAERIFKSVTESLKFTDNRLLEAGSKIVAEIKDKGLDSFLASVGNKQEWDMESFFLIKDDRGRTIGFTMEVLGCPEPGRFGAGSFYYIRRQPEQEHLSFFQSGNNLTEFVWKSETSGPSGKSRAEIVLDKNEIMTVKEFDLQTKEKDYQISPAAIPDVLSEFIFSQMIDNNSRKILVDTIESDGKITPTFISRTDAHSPAALQSQSSETDVAKEETAYVFEVEILDGRGFSEQVYLNSQKQISKMLLQQESIYTLERTSAENILREFPEQASYILQSSMDSLRRKDKMPEQNQLQESSER